MVREPWSLVALHCTACVLSCCVLPVLCHFVTCLIFSIYLSILDILFVLERRSRGAYKGAWKSRIKKAKKAKPSPLPCFLPRVGHMLQLDSLAGGGCVGGVVGETFMFE